MRLDELVAFMESVLTSAAASSEADLEDLTRLAADLETLFSAVDSVRDRVSDVRHEVSKAEEAVSAAESETKSAQLSNLVQKLRPEATISRTKTLFRKIGAKAQTWSSSRGAADKESAPAAAAEATVDLGGVDDASDDGELSQSAGASETSGKTGSGAGASSTDAPRSAPRRKGKNKKKVAEIGKGGTKLFHKPENVE